MLKRIVAAMLSVLVISGSVLISTVYASESLESEVSGSEIAQEETLDGETPELPESSDEETNKTVALASDSDVAVIASTSVASGKCGNNLTWQLDDAGTLTISGSGDMDNMDLNASPWSKQLSKIKKVVFQSGVTSVGDFAFSSASNLTNVTFCDTITSIGIQAFGSCPKLKNFTLPSNLSELKDFAFSHCPSITSVTIPDTVTWLRYTFSGATGLTDVNIGKSVIDYYGAFANCTSLQNIKVSSQNQYLESIDGVLYLKENEWGYNSIINNKTYATKKSVLLQYPAGKTNTSYTVKSGTGAIGESAFGGAKQLKKVTLPSGLIYTDRNAFLYCSSLASVTLPDTLTAIGDSTFFDCKSLKTIQIPKSVVAIDEESIGYLNIAEDPEITMVGKVSGFTIQGYANTAAQTYAKKNGFTFKDLDSNCDNGNHTWVKTSTTKATLQKNGKISYKCSDCGKTKSTVVYYPKKITLSATSYNYNGKVKHPSVTVKDSNSKTVSTSNYTVSYSSGCKNPGTYTVTIKFKGNYTGTVKKTFKIVKKQTLPNTNLSKTIGAKAFTLKVSLKEKPKITFASSNKKVATINANGKITLKGVGKTTITVKTTATKHYKATTEKFTVTVKPKGTTLKSASSPKNGAASFKWTKKSGITGYQIRYSLKSNMSGSRTVTAKASAVSKTISGLSKGKKYYAQVRTYKKVSGTNYYSSWSAKKSVTVLNVKINTTSATLYTGGTKTLSVSGGKGTVTWKSSDPKIAKVNSNGKVTALKKGTATITAKRSNVTVKCKITVKTQSLSATNCSLMVGNSKQLKLNNAVKAVTWKSSNTKVAKVTSSGVVTAVGKGTANITATHNGVNYTCKVTVNALTYGKVTGNITYYYNSYVGHVADANAKVILIPKDKTAANADLSFFSIASEKEKYHVYTTTVDGTGSYMFDRVVSGEYRLFIISNKTTSEEWFDVYDESIGDAPASYYDEIAQLFYAPGYLNKKTATNFANLVFANQCVFKDITVDKNKTTQFSFDFGITYI